MVSQLRIIVTGLIGQHRLGGVTWDYVQYPLGLSRLGHDVYYFEDSGAWPYDPEGGVTGKDFGAKDCARNVEYLAGIMARFGLEDRWAYRCPIDWQWFGLPDRRRTEVVDTADLLVNVSGTLVRPEEYRQVRRLAYIDSDPVFTQIKLARGQRSFQQQLDLHDVHFSFGECLSGAGPPTSYHWRPTRQPMVLSEWEPIEQRREVFTTVMNWASYNSISYGGQTYGQKDVEFLRFIGLPARVAPTVLELAVQGTKRRELPRSLITRLVHNGWQVVDPARACPDVDSYRTYLRSSKAEWSVAKNGYVAGRSGWFSCRSTCYLAAGRPVVVQDTGFSDVLPVGAGILAFSTAEEAVTGIREVEGRYEHHSRAARSIAEEYFDSNKVLTRLVEEAMSCEAHSVADEVRL